MKAQQTGIEPRIKFFNFFRNVFRIPFLEKSLAVLTSGKGYDSIFVKCIPQNYQYPPGTFRIAERNGIKYRLDLSEYMDWVIYFGLSVEERDLLYPLIKKDDVVLDIGTNIGETLLNFAKITGPGGYVYGFEPVKYNYDKCMVNVNLNDFRNLKVFRIALSDRNETLYFEKATNRNSGGIAMKKEAGAEVDSVEALTLDNFVSTHSIENITFIKLDVEGFETNVLRGGSAAIQRFRPVLFVEVDAANLEKQNSSSEQLISLIESYGYSVRNSDPDATANNEKHYDIIAVPIEKSK
jgi:FkbM family methyltransferase